MQGAGAVWSEQLGLCLRPGLWSGAAAVQVGCAKARIISLDSPCYFLVVYWLLTYLLLTYLLTYVRTLLTIISLGSPCTIAGECVP